MRRFVLPSVLLLAGCVGPAPAPISSACGWDKVIHPSPQDTMETLRQVDDHNKALRAGCRELVAS